MKKASTKGIEKDLEGIAERAEKIGKRIETALKTLQANKFSITNDNHITTIQNIRRDLRDSSEQLQRWLGL